MSLKNNRIDALLFIDTNIFLDFYRDRKSDISMQFLAQIEKFKNKLILSSQIEMEYKKNRQRVILESLGKYKNQDSNNFISLALISDTQPIKMIEKYKKSITSQQGLVHEKIQKILHNPISNDEVYKSLQRIFKYKSEYNLDRENKQRFKVRRDARKRFCLGYPPRKPNDTSYGDAINWEWIIECANNSGKDIIIVSRDNDYGITYKEQSTLNDWLRQEFKQRVSKKRKIKLTGNLSKALKSIDAQVTQAMEDEEQKLIKEFINRYL